MKATFSNIREAIHIYAQFSQDKGKSGNVFFDGDTLYSYGYHFPLAHRAIGYDGGEAILLNGRSYSNSTSKHQNWTRQATSHYRQIVSFGMSRYDKTTTYSHKANESHYINKLETIARNLSTSRKPSKWIEQAQQLNGQLMEYAAFFNAKPSQEYKTAFFNATNVSEEIKAKVRAEQAESLKRKKEKAIEEAKELEVKIQEWITGERHSLYPRPAKDLLRLRIMAGGDKVVETSQGIAMTTDEAKAIYQRILAKTLKAGDKVLDHYTVISINGVVKIGCHTFDTEYLLTFGKSL